jgi:hypothetical protein
VYSLECTDIPKVFYTPYNLSHCCINVVPGYCCTTMGALGSHCCAIMGPPVSTSPISFYQTTRSSIPKDCHLHTRRRENFKSHIVDGNFKWILRISLVSLCPNNLSTYFISSSKYLQISYSVSIFHLILTLSQNFISADSILLRLS